LTAATQEFSLRLNKISKSYGANRVVSDLDLEFHGGEILGLLGANGAGKSTVCRIIAGLETPSGGEMKVQERRYAPGAKADAESLGIQIVQQELNLIPTLTVAENLFLNRLPSLSGWIRRRELSRRASAALSRVGLDRLSPDALVSDLGVGTQQMVEIAAAFDRQCKLLILDEPTAALSLKETETLFERLAEFRSAGVGVVYISHRLEEIRRLTDRIAILRDGQLVAQHQTHECTTEQMIYLMAGDSRENDQPQPAEKSARCCILKVEGLSRQPLVQNVHFEVSSGEILGVAGLVGSGRTELLRAVFGADRVDEGAIYVAGRNSSRPFRSPRQAVAAGIAMVTEDRKSEGLLLGQSIRVNVAIGLMRKVAGRLGGIRRKEESRCVSELLGSTSVRFESLEQNVETLSGGNQQKVVMSKWLGRDAQLFLIDEPTRGIDISSRRKIYDVLRGLSNAGKAIVMVSSDMDELFEVCDRIMVMSAGTVAGMFTRDSWNREQVMDACFSGYVTSENGNRNVLDAM
jgi:ribose transport system ATP-binding protein